MQKRKRAKKDLSLTLRLCASTGDVSLRLASKLLYRQHRGQVKPFGTVCFLLCNLCDPAAALRFTGFTVVVTAEAPRTAELAEKTFEAKPLVALERQLSAELELTG